MEETTNPYLSDHTGPEIDESVRETQGLSRTIQAAVAPLATKAALTETNTALEAEKTRAKGAEKTLDDKLKVVEENVSSTLSAFSTEQQQKIDEFQTSINEQIAEQDANIKQQIEEQNENVDNKLQETDEQLATLGSKVDKISKEEIETEGESIDIEDNNGNNVFHLDENGLDAKNVKSNGIDIIDAINKKQEKIVQVSKESSLSEDSEQVFASDDYNGEEGEKYASIGSYGIKSKAYFDLEGNPIGGDGNRIKYVDCLGDSLTMGWSATGYYETKLQELLGNNYAVRNFGVGGEEVATIMARQGSISTRFNSDFTLGSSVVQIGIIDSDFNSQHIQPLKQGKQSCVNPCYIDGVECTLSHVSGAVYSLQQNNYVNDRKISANTPIYFNTGKLMGSAEITILWMGTNGGFGTTEDGYFDIDKLVDAYEKCVSQLPNNKFIIIGLHNTAPKDARFPVALAKEYEKKMKLKFGNKFFNLREYCCGNFIYDAGITPTSSDLEQMSNGICPSSLMLANDIHFKPASNNALGVKLYEIIKHLGY